MQVHCAGGRVARSYGTSLYRTWKQPFWMKLNMPLLHSSPAFTYCVQVAPLENTRRHSGKDTNRHARPIGKHEGIRILFTKRHCAYSMSCRAYFVGKRFASFFECRTTVCHSLFPLSKAMVYCGNNARSQSLKVNGGDDTFGNHRQCFRKGYARGYNQTISDIPRFVQKWSGGYKAYIAQKLWHSDDPVPAGYQRATLSQTMQRGFAIGSIALSKKLQQKAPAKSPPSTKRPTLPITTRH